jgi:hypothetical protein
MWLVDAGRLGTSLNRGWSTRRQGSAESRLVTVRINTRLSPSSQPCTDRSTFSTTCSDVHGAVAGRTVGQDRRLRTASLDPHTSYATDRTNDIRGSPSCTGVGVVKLGRGVSVIGVSRPRPISIRASPPDSGVVPFSSRNPSGAKSERQRIPPVVSCSPLGLVKANPGPYVSGTMGTSDRNNHAYGISCRTRPIPIVSTRSDYLGTGTAWAVQSAQNK